MNPAGATEMAKIEPKFHTEDDFDRFVLGMFLLYATRPRKQDSEPDGSFFIGEVGDARLENQRLSRGTPYSICKGIRK